MVIQNVFDADENIMHFLKKMFPNMKSYELIGSSLVDYWTEKFSVLIDNETIIEFEYDRDDQIFEEVVITDVKQHIKENRITPNGERDKEFRKFWEQRGYTEYFNSLNKKKNRKYLPPFMCPSCAKKVLQTKGENEKCIACGWIDDEAQSMFPDLEGGENQMSLNQFKKVHGFD